MSKEIKKIEIKIENKVKEIEKFKKTISQDKRPDHKDYKCSKCNAKKNSHCISPGGYVAPMGHKERNTLADKDGQLFYKKQVAIEEFLQKLESELKGLLENKKQFKKEAEIAKKVKQFKLSVKPTSKLSALVVEKNRFGLTVLKIRNLTGLLPGDSVPSPSVLENLMRKKVDVTIIREENNLIAKSFVPYQTFDWRSNE